jgi:hypothetical protein
MFPRHGQTFCAGLGDEHLEAIVACQVQQHFAVVRIVLDDQQHALVGAQIVAIVDQLLGTQRQRQRLEWRGR